MIMNPRIASLTITATLVFGSVAIAESPVVLRVRKEVNAIDARTRSLKKSTIKKEVGGGQAELTLWKEKSGKLVHAVVGNYGDRGETVTRLYWSGDKLRFAFQTWNSDDGANLMPGPEKKKTKNHIKEWRVYFEGGKPAVVRLRKGDVASGASKLGASVPNVDVRQGDDEAKAVLQQIATDAKTARKGNLNDES